MLVPIVQGETITLELTESIGPARRWEAHPRGLVELDPSVDGRSCAVRAPPDAPLGIGRATVKATDAAGRGVGYFALEIKAAGGTAPTPADPEAAATALATTRTAVTRAVEGAPATAPETAPEPLTSTHPGA